MLAQCPLVLLGVLLQSWSHPLLWDWQEKTDEDEAPAPTEALEEARAQALAVALQAGQVQQQQGMTVPADDFVAGALKWGMMPVSAPLHVYIVVSGVSQY